MKYKWYGFALSATLIAAAWTLSYAQAPPAGPGGPGAAAGRGGQRGGGGGAGGARGGGAAGGGGQRGGARGGGGGGGQPAPKGPDGHPYLSPGPGQTGLWHGAFTMTGANIPYQPWARGVAEVRQRDKLEPHARCKPSGAVRQFQTPYGVDIVEMPELQRVYFMDVGGPHTYRIIYMDGRQHPKDLVPSYYGHSTGSWDGDTFVVDTVGYNEKFWLDRGDSANTGFVHTEQLHTIEKFTRTAFNSMRYELTIDDPGAYTEPWTAGNYALTLQPTEELFEYICQDNNQGGELMVGTLGTVSRKTQIVP
ncbi:MAG TPA: hypothetical protein VFY29_08335 [Terriglobia bacterium]|nr:hypothetical protein [Terriglobia bacterium]